VNSVSPFILNGTGFQFGTPGQTFRTSLTGHLTTTSPPSGYFGGYATGTNDSVPFLSATPNPAPPANSAGLVQVTLTWGAPGASQVEIHLGAPDGVFMTGGGSSGSATTGGWVPNGMKFYLQDVSGGKALTGANTLADLTVVVRP
jgi:hypothetical protein